VPCSWRCTGCHEVQGHELVNKGKNLPVHVGGKKLTYYSTRFIFALKMKWDLIRYKGSKISHECVTKNDSGGLDHSGQIQQFSTFLCLWPTSEFYSLLWLPLVLFNYNKYNIYNEYVLYQLGYLYESVMTQNTAKRKQLDITTIQKHNKTKKGGHHYKDLWGLQAAPQYSVLTEGAQGHKPY
jgi:hypothetical protein